MGSEKPGDRPNVIERSLVTRAGGGEHDRLRAVVPDRTQSIGERDGEQGVRPHRVRDDTSRCLIGDVDAHVIAAREQQWHDDARLIDDVGDRGWTVVEITDAHLERWARPSYLCGDRLDNLGEACVRAPMSSQD